MILSWLWALSGCKTAVDFDPADRVVCDQYIACAEAVDDFLFPEYADEFGPNGTCWDEGDLSSCVEQCQVGFDELPYIDDPRCEGKSPSADCAVILGREATCPDAPPIYVPEICGQRPGIEACKAEAILTCSADVVGDLFLCSADH